MGRVGGGKMWVGPQRPMGATVVVMVAAMVLLSAPAGQAFASYHICPTHTNSVDIVSHETVFFGTNFLTMTVRMEADGCVNETVVLDLWEFTVTNETSRSESNLKWYEFNFINCGNNVAKIGSKVVKFEHNMSSPQCVDKLFTLTVGPNVLLGRKCIRSSRRMEVEESKAACMTLLQRVPDTDHSLSSEPARSAIKELFDLFDEKKYDRSELYGDQHDPVQPSVDIDLKNLYDSFGGLYGSQPNAKIPEVDKGVSFLSNPKINFDDILPATPPTPSTYLVDDTKYFDRGTGFTKRNYKENAIPIFIGIVAFTVSMCLRFCLCRGKSVVRRVTTVTVIRSRPVSPPEAPQDQQDPPPSYIDVVNEGTSPQDPADEGSAEPPPPSYADIVDEVQPPTYSEVEAQSMPASEEVPLADQEAEAQTTSSLPHPESVPDAKDSASSKSMLSKYRSQQKQFAFKVLEEDD